ncbi:MAG: hypothetical protein Kow0090_14180 [Myxococcota bacterium]
MFISPNPCLYKSDVAEYAETTETTNTRPESIIIFTRKSNLEPSENDLPLLMDNNKKVNIKNPQYYIRLLANRQPPAIFVVIAKRKYPLV